MRLVWLGHSAFHLDIDGVDILIDPFFTGNPSFPSGYEERIGKVDIIAITHAHFDHVGDTLRLAPKYGSVVVAQYDLYQYLESQGLDRFEPMNIGGSVPVGDLVFSMVPAQHSATLTENGRVVAVGDPAGFVIKGGGRTIYHAGDTGLFSDMALIQRLHRPDIGILPIGDRFTMGPEAAAIACNEFFDFDIVIPVHWGTFPMLHGRPEAFREQVKRGRVMQLVPGEAVEFASREVVEP